jgi:hypothetical protein
MAASVETASAVESPASAMKAAATVEPAALETTSTLEAASATEAIAASEALVTAETMPSTTAAEFTPAKIVTIPTSAIETMPSAVVPASVESVEPRPGTDKNAASKVLRAIVAVWRARVWEVAVITVRADRRRPNVNGTTTDDNRPDSHANPHSHLRVGRTCARNEYKQSQYDEVL